MTNVLLERRSVQIFDAALALSVSHGDVVFFQVPALDATSLRRLRLHEPLFTAWIDTRRGDVMDTNYPYCQEVDKR